MLLHFILFVIPNQQRSGIKSRPINLLPLGRLIDDISYLPLNHLFSPIDQLHKIIYINITDQNKINDLAVNTSAKAAREINLLHISQSFNHIDYDFIQSDMLEDYIVDLLI